MDSVAICIRTFSGIFKGRNYNRLHFLKQSLKSLFANTLISHKIIVVDDFSTNQKHLDYLRKLHKSNKIKLIEKNSKTGRQHSFALQRYYGYHSGCQYIKVADDDFIYSRGWLTKMVKAYKDIKKHYTNKPIGVLTAFNRAGAKYPTLKINNKIYGYNTKWVGGNWLMSREVAKKGGINIYPTQHFPKQWTSPWIDDGSYQLDLTKKHGFAHAFIMLNEPSLIDHIGEFGVHAPGIFVRGKK